MNMSRRVEFDDPDYVQTLVEDMVKKISPKIKSQVARRNQVRDKRETLVNKIAGLEERQEVLKDEVSKLRLEGSERILTDKNNIGLSIKINTREAELKENEGWLAEFKPQAEQLAQEVAGMNKALLDTLREHLQPVYLEKQKAMNDLLYEASRLRQSFYKAIPKAIDILGDSPHLHGGITAPQYSYRLKVDWTRSMFLSPNR
jgi:hypothetical protein